MGDAGQSTLIYDGRTRRLNFQVELSTPSVIASTAKQSDLARSHLTLHLLTPMRLLFDEALANRLDFHILIRTLLRRLSALSYFHCGRQLDLDFKGLIARAEQITTDTAALRWVDWDRYSNRQKRKIQMGGLIGHVTYTGPLADFLPFIQLGELVHVGKGAVFGLGKYHITDAVIASATQQSLNVTREGACS